MPARLARFSMLAASAVLLACGGGGGGGATTGGGTTPPSATPGLVATGCGTYQGAAQGTTYAFLGIRYAAAPTGTQRWRPPQPPSCPSGTQQATSFGPKCPQLDRDSGAFTGTEDCLTLNVWIPSSATGNTSARRPVMFFIHGGGNSIGSTSETVTGGAALYRGDRLAAARAVVVVTANYRLGPLGFLTHAGLDAESVQGVSGNYALLDQLAVLRWIRDNIAAFGGDPSRVLVFGQSAGGQDTCMLLASPLAAGLISAAAIQSGGCPGRTRAAADAATASLASQAGCSATGNVLACLRGKTPEELLRADPPVIDVAGAQAPWQPHVDGYVLRDRPLATFNAGGQNRVPVIITATTDETSRDVSQLLTESQYTTLLGSVFGTLAPLVLAQYPVAQYGSPWRAYTQLTTDVKFVCPSRSVARALARTQQEPVFRGLFAETLDAVAARNFGAFHGADLLFLFDNLDAGGYQATTGERALADAMQQYLAGLAASRDPNAQGLTAWARYDGSQDNHLVLEGGKIRMENGLRTQKCDFWDQLLPAP